MTAHRIPMDPARRLDLNAYILLARGAIMDGGQAPRHLLLAVTDSGRGTASISHDAGHLRLMGVTGAVKGQTPTAAALLDAWVTAALDRLAAEVRP